MDRANVINALADVALSSNEMEYAYRVRTASGTGTCFLYGDKRGFFFVTAAHILKAVKAGGNVLFSHESGWLPQKVEAIFCHPSGHDIAAFVTDQPIGGKSDFDNDFLVMPGQPLKFLGFPHGLQSNYPSQFGYHTPLVRSAHFSGVTLINGQATTILDGFNNPGYSGGPIYGCGADGLPKLFGVISGYRHEAETHSKVYCRNEVGEIEQASQYFVQANSGMIYAIGKREYLELFGLVNHFQRGPRA